MLMLLMILFIIPETFGYAFNDLHERSVFAMKSARTFLRNTLTRNKLNILKIPEISYTLWKFQLIIRYNYNFLEDFGANSNLYYDEWNNKIWNIS